MSSKTTSFILLKSQKCGHVMPAGAVGAVRPVVAILPTATAAGPSHSRSHGRLRRSEGPLIINPLGNCCHGQKGGQMQSSVQFGVQH